MIAIGGERNAASGVDPRCWMLQAQNRRVASGAFDRVEEELMVILRKHPSGVGQKFK
jgi:hypothetical protein